MKEPPFCPHPDCVLHRPALTLKNWFMRKGHFSTQSRKRIQRFKCKVCGKWFSSQTFHIEYYAKKRVDYFTLIHYLSEGLSIRAMQRLSGLNRNTIQNKVDRVSRYCIAKTVKILGKLRVKEHLAADGFESFARSQYFPHNIHVLVGTDSQFLYFFNHAALKRKGRMTESQKRRRNELYRQCGFERNGIRQAFREVAERIGQMIFHQAKCPLTLYTDQKREYRQALEGMRRAYGGKREIVHVRISSRKKRTKRNRLFPVNYMDREFRKDQAAFRRESTCFARSTNNALSRLNVYAAYHNFSKRYRLNGEGRRFTHAEVAGVSAAESRGFWNDLSTGRGFRKLSFLWGFLDDLWLKKVATPYHENHYVPQYAYV
jgi:transposase-like protein